MRLHHVQVASPSGGEDASRQFYGAGLGLTEVQKPPALQGRGGLWFRSIDTTGEIAAEIHVGIEDPFSPALKAHPAFLLASVAELDAVGERLGSFGFRVDWSDRDTFDGYVRFHTRDAHGNRVEVLAPLAT